MKKTIIFLITIFFFDHVYAHELPCFLIKEYNQIWENAEGAMSKHPDLLDRVKTVRLLIYYSILEIARTVETRGRRSAFVSEPPFMACKANSIVAVGENVCIK